MDSVRGREKLSKTQPRHVIMHFQTKKCSRSRRVEEAGLLNGTV